MSKRFAAALLLLFLPAGCAGRTPVTSASEPNATAIACGPILASSMFSQAGTESLSPTSRAFYAFGRDSTRSGGYLLIVRGAPLWSDAGGAVGGGGRVDGPAPREHRWDAGGESFTVLYDPRDATIAVAGSRIALDSANVVLLDRSDEAPDRLVVRGAVCAPPLRPDFIAEDLWERVPAARAFVSARGGT